MDDDADMGDGTAPGHGSGTGGPSWEELPGREVRGLHLLAVDPAARGRHVSVALLDAVAREARSEGARVLRLNTSVQSVEANAMYTRCRFTRHRPMWLPYPDLPMPGWTNLWELRL